MVSLAMCGREGPSDSADLYYAGRKAEAEGRVEDAATYYREQYRQRGGDIYDLEGVKRLARILLDEGAFREAFRITGEAMDRFERNPVFLGLYTEACLGLERNRRALWAAHEAWDQYGGAEELALLTEASRRSGLPVWKDRLLRLSLDYPFSEAHVRADTGLSDAAESTGEPECVLIRGKAAAAEGNIEEALENFRFFFDGGGETTPLLVREIGDMYADTGREEEAISFFTSLLDAGDAYPENVRAVMVEQAVRFLFSEDRYDELLQLVEEGLKAGETVTGLSARYVLAALVRTEGPAAAAAAAERLLPDVDTPSTCSTILDEIISLLVRKGMWPEIQSLAGALAARGPRREAARCLYITARAVDEGYIDGDDEESEDLFRAAADRDPGGYYGFLGGLGYSVEPVSIQSAGPAAEEEDGSDDDLAKVITGMLERGMEEEGLAEAYAGISALSSAGAAGISDAAADRGLYLDALRIMLRWNASRDRPPGEEILRRLFPLRFYEDIFEAVEAQGVPLHVFLALVREESAFQPDIVSRSGAVGLSQLMPSTADYAAGLMSLDAFEITDPGDNTMIGSWYLARVRSGLPSYGHSLAAYNAGPGRVAEWMGLYGRLPADLFAEAIPFLETRRYVKRVLVSTVYYGYLYGAVSPEESVRLYYF